jgi:hypothetical protein
LIRVITNTMITNAAKERAMAMLRPRLALAA